MKKIIKWGDSISGTYDFEVLHWDEVKTLGMDDIDDEPVLSRQKSMAINQCCVLVYTSGTTGNPKGNTVYLKARVKSIDYISL